MSNIVTTNEWTSPHETMPPAGREVLVMIERTLKSGNIEVCYGGVLRYNGAYWVDANTNTRVDVRVHRWYMFERYYNNKKKQ